MKISILKAFALVLSISAVMVFAYPDHPAFIKELGDDEVLYGVAILYPDGGSGVSGNVKLRQQGTTTNIKATVYGLPVGDHGIHIHEFGNLLQGCTTAGSHYNPYNKQHGGPDFPERHDGDCGNISMKQGDNVAILELNSDIIKLNGPTSVIGRAFVVHKDFDDLGLGPYPDSKTTGHSGARVACGVIGISGPLTEW